MSSVQLLDKTRKDLENFYTIIISSKVVFNDIL